MPKDPHIRRCKACGFPRALGFYLRWNDNGTITSFLTKHFAGIILHADLVNGLFQNIEEQLGVSIGHIAFEAQRNIIEELMNSMVKFIPGARFALRFSIIKRMSVKFFHVISARLGMCVSGTVEYVPGQYGIARIKNPFNLDLMAAIIVGAFEFLEKKPFDHSLEIVSKDEYRIKVEAVSGKPAISERLRMESTEFEPGDLKFQRCPRCKVPLGISEKYAAKESEGLILDKRTNARVLITESYIMDTVFREIEKELGDEVFQLMLETEKKLIVDNMELLGLKPGARSLSDEDFKSDYENKLMDIPLCGLGNPIESDISRSGVRVVISNPYNKVIIGGMLAGIFEALTGNTCDVTWDELSGSRVAYIVK